MSTTDKVLLLLFERGPQGCSAVGEVITNRSGGPRVGSNGGGDYAAQMLLGRMKKKGLVRHAHSPGSTVWELTSAGRERARSQK